MIYDDLKQKMGGIFASHTDVLSYKKFVTLSLKINGCMLEPCPCIHVLALFPLYGKDYSFMRMA